MIDTYHLTSSPSPPVPKFNRSLSLAYFVILIFCVNEVANRISPFSSSVWDLLSDSQLVSAQLNQYVYMYVASFMIWYLVHTLLQCALFLYQKNWEFVLFFLFFIMYSFDCILTQCFRKYFVFIPYMWSDWTTLSERNRCQH